MALGCRIVTRSGSGGHPVLVFDRRERLHLPLTVFAGEAVKRSSSGTARLYLNVLVPFFDGSRADESDGELIEAGTIHLKPFGKELGTTWSSV